MTKRAAQLLGQQALKRMKTKGWKIDVWENLGWHVALRKNGMNISISKYPTGEILYSTLFSTRNEVSGEIFWSTSNRLSDPNAVVRLQLERAQIFVNQCQRAINRVKRGK